MDEFSERNFNLSINEFIKYIVSQIKLKSPCFFDEEDPFAKLEYMRDGLTLLKEVIKKFYSLDNNEVVDFLENYNLDKISDEEMIKLSGILHGIGIWLKKDYAYIPIIAKRDIREYYSEFGHMDIDEIIEEIEKVIDSINIFINRDDTKVFEYLKNLWKLKDILVIWTFFSNFVLDYKYYMEESLFLDKIPRCIFYEITKKYVKKDLNNKEYIEKIKSFNPIIKQLIKFQFKYFPYLSKSPYYFNKVEEKIYEKMKKLLCIYTIYFLLLRAIENKKEDFVRFYYYILDDLLFVNGNFYGYVEELLYPVFSALKNEGLEVPKMPDFSKIDISDEDFLFSLASKFSEEINRKMSSALCACREILEKYAGKGLSGDEKIEFRILYVKNLVFEKHPITKLIDETITDEKLKEKVIRFLAGVEDVSKEIKIPLIPIENNEGELVKN